MKLGIQRCESPRIPWPSVDRALASYPSIPRFRGGNPNSIQVRPAGNPQNAHNVHPHTHTPRLRETS